MTISQKTRDEIAASDCVTCKWLWDGFLREEDKSDRYQTASLQALNDHRQRFHPEPVKWK